MQLPIRKTVLGLMLASGAMAASAQSKTVEATAAKDPAATPAPAPINLSLPSNSILPATPATAPFATMPAAKSPSAMLPGASNPAAPAASRMDRALQAAESQPAKSLAPAPLPAAGGPADAIDLALQSASAEIQRVAHWVASTRDNAGLPYLLIDKVNATVYAFNRAGLLQGSAPVLLGMGKGDRLVVGNDIKMAQMGPDQRITPAGRFVSRLGIDSHGKELLIMDYDAAISLHAVVKGTPEERRAERLNSKTSEDNRISFGCINVPTTFYSDIVSTSFRGTRGIVYVLPETGPASSLFKMDPAPGTAVAGSLPGAAAVESGATRADQASAAR